MDKEVEPAVLAVINEKRLLGDKRTPVEIIARMGVFDARQKASDQAWLASGDNVIATVWAEFVSVAASGPWFCLEPLEPERRLDGEERTALQTQRAKDRLALLKRSLDEDRPLRVVLQTNRVAIANLETDKAAKVSTRVPDDQEWHVAEWDPVKKIALLVRGPRGWLPGEDEVKAARERGGVPPAAPESRSGQASRDELQEAAIDYLSRHFGGYGYKTERVSGQQLGYDIEVTDKKGNTLLKLAVKGTTPATTGYQLSAEERACAARGDPWRLAVVSEPLDKSVQHKLYKSTEIASAPGLQN